MGYRSYFSPKGLELKVHDLLPNVQLLSYRDPALER
jgi:hypothetical protein